MPIRLPKDLPATEILQKENVFAISDTRANHQDIRPLEILVANLMPDKINAEVQLLRLLSQSPLQVNATLLKMSQHESKHTSATHLEKFYQEFARLQDLTFDAMIITGAPLEKIPFEEVDYWQELTTIMDWSQSHCTSVLHICWGAQAGLYHHFGIEKVLYAKKLFGIYPQIATDLDSPLLTGFDDCFYTPQSRYTGINPKQVAESSLQVLAASSEIGPTILVSPDEKNIFLLGHFEYETSTLDEEYRRDHQRGLTTALPQNYYLNDDPQQTIVNRWRGHATLFFLNWLNEVYQVTPYDLSKILVNERCKRW
ncbi:homoserine O-succinyltransferase [Enterococcus nangangensis]|uniref:homoserine O-succinyltransferase n=1 Tax=Enterococcus nangangensis TaxID=2559926 RepID=UPI0010F6672A|nr:homoserine O-succinyltransferase [Enterococcus nangangensis]